MTRSFLPAALSVVLTAVTLNGCALQKRLKQVDTEASQTRQTITRTQSAFEARTNNRAQKLKAQQVEKPWLTSRAVPLSREVTLPVALQHPVLLPLHGLPPHLSGINRPLGAGLTQPAISRVALRNFLC